MSTYNFGISFNSSAVRILELIMQFKGVDTI